MSDEKLWTIKEIAEEVEKLLKYTVQMKVVTRYKGGEVPKFQIKSQLLNSM